MKQFFDEYMYTVTHITYNVAQCFMYAGIGYLAFKLAGVV